MDPLPVRVLPRRAHHRARSPLTTAEADARAGVTRIGKGWGRFPVKSAACGARPA